MPRVVVRDLGNRGEKEELRRIFSKFGPLTNVWVADDPPGFAYVFFERFRDAEEAVDSTNDSKVCGMRVRVELSPIEDRRAQQGGYRGRGRGDYNRFSSGSRGRSGTTSRPSYESRDSGGSRGGRSSYGSYSSDRDRSDYSRGRGRGGQGRGDYSSSSSSGRGGYSRGRGGGQYGYSSGGGAHSSGSGNYSSGYSTGYSGSSSSYQRGRGSRGSSYSSYRGGGGGSREGGGYQRSNYRNDRSDRNDYSGSDYNQNYRSQGQRGGGSYSSYRGRGRGGPQRSSEHSGDYDSRQRRDTRSDHIRAREREYQSEYGYGSSRNTGGDYEYREHRSKNRGDDYSSGGQYSSGHKDDYKRSSRDTYRRHSTSSYDGYKEPLKRPSRYRKEEKGYSSKDYQDEQWESEDYRERSPHRSRYDDDHYREASPKRSPRKRDDDYLEDQGSGYHDYSPRGSYHERTPEDTGYEHVDQYPAIEDYRTEGSQPRTPPDYHRSRSYTPESRRVEFGDEATERSETKRYEGDDDHDGEHDREVREVVEFKDQEESERYVKLDEKRDTHYERDTHRERERDREREKRHRPYPAEEARYSPARKGGSRHRSPSPPPRRRRSVNL